MPEILGGNFRPRIPILWRMTGLLLETHVDIDVYHSDGWVVHMKAYKYEHTSHQYDINYLSWSVRLSVIHIPHATCILWISFGKYWQIIFRSTFFRCQGQKMDVLLRRHESAGPAQLFAMRKDQLRHAKIDLRPCSCMVLCGTFQDLFDTRTPIPDPS